MVTKRVNKDLMNLKGEKKLENQVVEVIDVWLNKLDNDIYVEIKNRHGVSVITNIGNLNEV